eukprot:1096916-Pyramimonas_sp.AAC.1
MSYINNAREREGGGGGAAMGQRRTVCHSSGGKVSLPLDLFASIEPPPAHMLTFVYYGREEERAATRCRTARL